MIKTLFLLGIVLLFLSGCTTKNSEYYTIIKEASKEGLLKNSGEVVVKPTYDKIKLSHENRKYDHPHLINLHWLHDDEGREFAMVKYNNKYGVINKESKFLLKPLYDHISSFFNGFARITLEGKVGLINEKFEVVLKPKYETIEEFYNDVAFVKSTSGLFGCIDKKMNLRIKPIFEKIYLEYNNHSKILQNGKWGFIDGQCKIIAKPIYEYVQDFSRGFAKIKSNGKVGYLNTKGQLFLKPIYDDGEIFR